MITVKIIENESENDFAFSMIFVFKVLYIYFSGSEKDRREY